MNRKVIGIMMMISLTGCDSADLKGISTTTQTNATTTITTSSTPTPTPIPVSSTNPTPTPIPASTHFVYVANQTDDTISQFGIVADGSGQLLPIAGNETIAAGHGPTELKMHPSKKFLYCLNPISNTINQYAVNATTGALSVLSPASVGVGTGSTYLAFDASGVLWVRISGQVLKYTVNTTTGQLTYVGTFSSGSTNVVFASAYATSLGAYIYQVNSSTDMIDVYNLSPMTLTPYSYAAGRNATSVVAF